MQVARREGLERKARSTRSQLAGVSTGVGGMEARLCSKRLGPEPILAAAQVAMLTKSEAGEA